MREILPTKRRMRCQENKSKSNKYSKKEQDRIHIKTISVAGKRQRKQEQKDRRYDNEIRYFAHSLINNNTVSHPKY